MDINYEEQYYFLKCYLEENYDVMDIPSEFCDPLLMTPIKEPVILPESKLIVDKNCIVSHLMLDQTDPFNRTKLTIDELEKFNQLEENKKTLDDFKIRFQKWKTNQLNNKSD